MLDKICGYHLDNNQQEIVLDVSDYLLVVAGAGSGKTLTILGKIYFLIYYKKLNPKEILCISFTRASANDLKQKILKEFKLNIDVYTFHKLSLEILKENNKYYEITSSDTLDNIIHEFFLTTVLDYPLHMLQILKYFKIKKRIDIKKEYLYFYKNNSSKFEILERLISTFLHLFKCNNYSFEYFSKFLDASKKTFLNFNYRREKIFLLLSLNIYILYQQYLNDNNEIDFDDMIIYATNEVEKNGINNKYKYVIIDEYQDTSYIRFLLIKSILDNSNSKLMVVGDDFQSIYRFTGCDVSLFLDFQKHFDNSKIMKIENTYRNSQELVTVASDFVMKNPYQIKKVLKSNKRLNTPIKIVYYNDIKKTFLKLVLEIYNSTFKPILVLGRNNNDVFMILSNDLKLKDNGRIEYIHNNKIEIYYLTVHKSKGLEEENVIIINLEDKLLGFPNKINDDKVLRFVNRGCEKFAYSEERRLFYVALTRTKNYVYLLAPIKNSSVFVNEILKYKKYVEIVKIN